MDQGPISRETIPDPHEVSVFIKREVRVLVLLQDPDGPELRIARSPRVQSRVRISRPPLRAAGHRRWRRRQSTRDVSNVATRDVSI